MATNSLNFRRGACALFLFFIVSTGLYGNEPSVHVLCYHAFKGDSNIFSFSLEELKSHIEHLKSHGYTFVTLDDVTNKRFTGTKNILVTVDDGNKSVYDAYFTVFKQYRIKPLLSIYPAVIEKKDYALTWKQLKELSYEGCSVAAHGFYHQKINRKLYESNRKMFDGEIYHSRDVLEQKLGKKIDVFVYPFGIASDITIQTLKAAGFRYGFTINCGGLSAGMLDSGLRYELPRYMFTRSSQKMNLGLIARNMIYHKKKTVAHEETSEQKKSARAADVKPVEEKRIAVRFQGTEKKTEADPAEKMLVDREDSGLMSVSDKAVHKRSSFGMLGNEMIFERAFAAAGEKVEIREKIRGGNNPKGILKDEKPEHKPVKKENAEHQEQRIKSEIKKSFYEITARAYATYVTAMNLFTDKIKKARGKAENLIQEKERHKRMD